MHPSVRALFVTTVGLFLLTSCGESSRRDVEFAAQSCMTCHNGSGEDDYGGPGIENPHPFGNADDLTCTTCHGGNPLGRDRLESHVPPPPEIGDREQWERDARAYFNRLTLTGIDKFPDYQVGGVSYSALDYLQFINPGDLRVVNDSRSCGMCHAPHVVTVSNSLLAGESGILSGAKYAIGAVNEIPENQVLSEDTAADLAFRAAQDQDPSFNSGSVGQVSRVLEYPVFSVFGDEGPLSIHNNPAYDSENLAAGLRADNSVVPDSPLANLYHEQVAFTCGDCHLGSSGANNRFGDFRSSGCTSCHMPYSLDGRSRSGDPNVDRTEPADPDDIDEPEIPHIRRHMILSVAKTLPSGEAVPGIDDYACAGCHQGSNRTVMQYWGIRLDQNSDLRNRVQYPANPVDFETTSGDPRLFNEEIGNRTFNGRNRNQYIRFEDYDGDGRDDTPADVHYDAGMGCIDCHGSYDLHGGDVNNPDGDLHSRMEQEVAITCESCHGDVDAYATTQPGFDLHGGPADVAVDRKGNPLSHVTRDAQGNYTLTSRLTGNVHYVTQTRDVVADSGKLHPVTQRPIYNVKASYCMGRADGNPGTGIGPQQANGTLNGFSHSDNVSCVSCHASWTNSCIGCHLEGEYNTGRNFSNITGERIVFRERNADFVYQSPIPFQLGVDTDNKIAPIAANTDVFFRYRDRNRDFSETFSFSDRNRNGNNRSRTAVPSLSHNVMMPHSIRGRVDSANEGPRYCVSCHLTEEGMANFGAEYTAFRNAMDADDFAALDYSLLQEHIGRNPGNQLNSPLWVHMVAGLGSGLFLFDENGCPVNPLDENDRRVGCDDVAPADQFNPNRVAFNLDRIVEPSGLATGSNNHPMENPGVGPNLRDGALNPNLSGPLGARLIRRLTDPSVGIVLDSWLDADGAVRGNAARFVGNQLPLTEERSGDRPEDREPRNHRNHPQPLIDRESSSKRARERTDAENES